MKKKVYLVDLGTGTDRSLLPLACGLISSYSHSKTVIAENYEIKILMMDGDLDDLCNEITDPFAVGISCYVWNFLGAVEISRRLKSKYPDTLIIWGGHCVPCRKERIGKFLSDYPWVDILVHGEGELTFADILLYSQNGRLFDDCPGITLRTPESGLTFITTRPRERIRDFSIIPSPFLDGTFDDVLERYQKQIVGVVWETNRGCPFHCSFCDWGSALVNKVSRLEIERVIKEIRWVSEKKIHYVYAADANFGIFFERDLEIAKHFVSIAKQNGFPNTLVLTWTKNSSEAVIKIAEILFEGGVITNTTISFQSLHPPTLKAVKRDNISLDTYRELKREFHNRQLPTYTELILGLPLETLETFVDGIEKSLSYRLEDQLAIYPLVLLENTELALEENISRYGLLSRRCAVGLNRRKFKYPRFGEDIIVVGTSTMPIDEWKRAYEIAFCTTALYNLRVAFFAIVYLKRVFGIAVTDFIKFFLDIVSENPKRFPMFAKAVNHLRRNCQLVLDSKSSVSPVEGSDGVALAPHEAMVFLLLNEMDQTYSELSEMVNEYCVEQGIEISQKELSELMLYQKVRMPVFRPSRATYYFDTSLPVFFQELTSGKEPLPVTDAPTTLKLLPKPHQFDSETEFNLRRVACGYTLEIYDVILTDDIRT